MPTDILALIGKAKPSLSKGGEGPPAAKGASDMMAGKDDSGDAESSLAGEAFDALQDGDRDGFMSAFVAAVEACVRKEKDEGYAEDSDDMGA